MAVIWSQGAVERLLGKEKASISGTNRLALVDSGTSADDTITDSSSGFSSAGFAVGDIVVVHGATDSLNNVAVPIIAKADGTLTVPTGSFTASQAAALGVTLTVKAHYNQCVAMMLRDVQIDVYSGTRPSRPDDVEQGTLLASFTGVRFADVSWSSTTYAGSINLYAGQTVSATAVASGTASWFRMRLCQTTTTGASTSYPRIDGDCGVGDTYDMRLSTTTITSGRPVAIESLAVILASSAT